MTDLTESDRAKIDTRPDTTFYDRPRFVTHADDAFLARLTELYATHLSPGDRLFDAMGSWVSHLPSVAFEHVLGHGLNEAELRENDAYDDWFTQDFNADRSLPLPDADRDAVVCALSVQYLQRPTDVFAEFARVLRPGGVVIVSFTNRMFPTKAIRAWRDASMSERVELVAGYCEAAGLTVVERVVERPGNDPFAAVVAEKE